MRYRSTSPCAPKAGTVPGLLGPEVADLLAKIRDNRLRNQGPRAYDWDCRVEFKMFNKALADGLAVISDTAVEYYGNKPVLTELGKARLNAHIAAARLLYDRERAARLAAEEAHQADTKADLRAAVGELVAYGVVEEDIDALPSYARTKLAQAIREYIGTAARMEREEAERAAREAKEAEEEAAKGLRKADEEQWGAEAEREAANYSATCIANAGGSN